MTNMIDAPRMLLIGSTGRGSGKTALATKIIAHFKDHTDIIGLKVSTIHSNKGECLRGGSGCRVCTSLDGPFALTEETSKNGSNDTSKLLSAGAHRVYWLCTKERHLASAVAFFLERVSPTGLIVCESNSVRAVVKPGSFLMTTDLRNEQIKASAREVRPFADRIITYDGTTQNFRVEDLHVDRRGVHITRRASALVLAGGSSRRMGSDKALLKVNGVAIIERIVCQLDELFPEVLISANDQAKYAFLNKRVIMDQHMEAGPIAGIGAGLAQCAHKRLFVTACDIPRINSDLVSELLSADNGYDVVVPVTPSGHFEPVHAIYDRRALEGIEQLLSSKNHKIVDLYGKCRTLAYPIDAPLPNLNTRDDYDSYLGASVT